jgi:hypothetical protein
MEISHPLIVLKTALALCTLSSRIPTELIPARLYMVFSARRFFQFIG